MHTRLSRIFLEFNKISVYTLVNFSFIFVLAVPASYTESLSSSFGNKNDTRRICSSIHIRNSLESFKKLENCEVIEGFLCIALIEKIEHNEYPSFPLLTEITDFMIIYRVYGLKSIGQLFPNLSVIRGHRKLNNKSLLIFEVKDSIEIGLYSLTHITSGQVFIYANPSMCYSKTIDWDRIVQDKSDKNIIRNNKPDTECPLCVSSIENGNSTKNCPVREVDGNVQYLCWNKNHCQKECPPGCKTCNNKLECCSDSCLACNYEDPKICKVCSQYIKTEIGPQKICGSTCPPDYFKYFNRRCLNQNQCLGLSGKITQGSCLLNGERDVPMPEERLPPTINVVATSPSSDSLLITWQPEFDLPLAYYYKVSIRKQIESINGQNYCNSTTKQEIPVTIPKVEDIKLMSYDNEIFNQRNMEDAIQNFVYIKRPVRNSRRATDDHSITFSSEESQYHIHDLEPYSLYEINVKVCQENKCTNNYNSITYRTKAKDGADKIENLQIEEKSKDTITISWDPPKHPNGKILAYIIEYGKIKEKHFESLWKKCLNLLTEEKKFIQVIPNIKSGFYSLSVTAVSLLKKGEPTYFNFSI